MIKKENSGKAFRIIEHYGVAHQKVKLCEECGELIQALCKSLSTEDSPEINSDIIEEFADVEVLIMQFQTIMGAYWFGELERTIGRKLDRQLERMESESVK